METERDKVACPKCGGADITLDERFWFSHQAFGVRNGVIEVSQVGEMSDEPTSDPAVLFCRSCRHKWVPPEDVNFVEEVNGDSDE